MRKDPNLLVTYNNKTSYSYRQVPTSIDFTYTRALFNLFRNVNVNVNYRNLRECRLQVSHVSVICRHGRVLRTFAHGFIMLPPRLVGNY